MILLRGTASGDRILFERVDAFDPVLCDGMDCLLGLREVPSSSPFCLTRRPPRGVGVERAWILPASLLFLRVK